MTLYQLVIIFSTDDDIRVIILLSLDEENP